MTPKLGTQIRLLFDLSVLYPGLKPLEMTPEIIERHSKPLALEFRIILQTLLSTV
jgi:hypothetical protein